MKIGSITTDSVKFVLFFDLNAHSVVPDLSMQYCDYELLVPSSVLYRILCIGGGGLCFIHSYACYCTSLLLNVLTLRNFLVRVKSL